MSAPTAPLLARTDAPRDPAAPARNAQSVRPPRTGAAPSKATAAIVLIVAGVLFAIPIVSMVLFTLSNGTSGGFTFAHWAALLSPTELANDAGLIQGITNSLIICVITVPLVLGVLLPAMLLAELRFPAARRVIEFVCIVPISVPTIVLVVGFVPVYQVIASLVGSEPWTLAFAIGIISLPFAFRPIQAAIDGVGVVVLAEAARSLGANWAVTVWRVLLPNLRGGILSAAFLTTAVVLGEFTIATFLSQTTFQTALLLVQQTNAYTAVIVSLLSLLFVIAVLLVLGIAGTRSRRSRSHS